MKTDLFIVSVGKHFNYLKYALRSISKFARGYHRVLVLFPDKDVDEFGVLAVEYSGEPPMHGIPFSEWPGLGMVHHMHQIMHADLFSEADVIQHFDSDWVFTEPVTPEDFMVEGKPLIVYGSFDWLVNHVEGNLRFWKEATLNAIGAPVPYETMRWPRLLYWRDLYAIARAEMERHTGKNMVEFMRAQRNEFPQSFCEYVTLGNVAWRRCKDRYVWRDQQIQGFLEPWKIYQAWSHQPPTESNMALYQKLGIV